MAKFGLVVKVIYLFIITSEVRAVSVVEVLFTDLSERLENLDRSFETKFDAINDRLDRLEEVVGVNELHSENDKVVENVLEGISQYTDIRNVKHQFMKAMATEKHNLRRFVIDYEQRFDEFKQNVKDILSEVNDTIKESNENLVSSMVQHTNSVREQLSDISFKIDTVDNNATIERDGIVSKLQIMGNRIITIGNNHTFQENKIKTLDSRITSLNSKHLSEIRALENRVTSVDTQRASDMSTLGNRVSNLDSSIDRRISSISERISTLHERKVGFNVDLSAKKQYSKGQTIVFDHTIYNYGYDFSTSTGKFTAPKSGTYLFSMSIEGTYKKSANAGLINDGSRVMLAYSDKGVDVTGSNTCVTYMYKGDKAWVQSEGDSMFYGYRTSFTGVLLD